MPLLADEDMVPLADILSGIRAEHGDRIMVFEPGDQLAPDTPLSDLLIIAAVAAAPERFDAPSLSRVLDAAKYFHHEEHADCLDSRLSSLVSDYLAGRLNWGEQPLRPRGGPTVILVTEPGEPDVWVDRWEQAGIVVFTGRAMRADFNDAAAAAEKHDLTVDEALDRLGWNKVTGKIPF